MVDFSHLHIHSCFSLMNGCGTIDKLIDRAKKLNFKSLAITDISTCSAYLDFQTLCEKNKIKPIFGVDICVVENYKQIIEVDKTDKTRDEISEEVKKTKEYDNLVLLSKNENGLKNIFNLVSEANINGYYIVPRIDLNFINQNKNGLICIAGGLNCKISKFFIDYFRIKKQDKEQANSKISLAIEYTKKLKEMFGKDLYLEINITEVPIQLEINKFFLKLSKKLEIPFIVSNNVFYPDETYFNAYNMLQKIKNKETIDSRRDLTSIFRYQWLFDINDFEKIWDKYCYSIDKKYLYEGLEKTNEIVDKCNVRIDTESKKSPIFILPENETDNREYLKKLAYNGLNKRFEIIFDDREKYRKQLEYELNVINDMGYTDYFLIVSEFIKWAKENEILVGSSRGSVGGSLLSYCLRITEIDPIKYGLLFERFLNKDRGGDFIVFELPDYDISKYSECDKDSNKIIKKLNDFCLEKLIKLNKNDKHHISRLEYEIKNVGFRKLEKYIFNVYKNKKEKIFNKPNSLIWYLLDICDGDDPIDKEPKTRIFGKSPDIDTDFQDDKREIVRDHLVNTWGKDSVASIVAYARYSSNNLFRDICRVYNIDFIEVNKVAKFIETMGEELGSFKPFSENVKEQSLLQDFLKKYEHFDIQNIIEKIEGQVKHVSIAAAGSVISSGRLSDMMSLRIREGKGKEEINHKERVLTEWEGNKLSNAGYLKIDLLGLKNLTIMKETLDMFGKNIEYIYKIPMDCQEVYEKLSRGDTEGIFQLEGDQITSLLVEIQPQNLEELAIVISLYRPAVLHAGLAKDYVKRKYGKQKIIYKYNKNNDDDSIVYLPEIFEDVLKDTYGVVIYQEQLIEIFHKLGLTYGEADLLRTAMSQYKQEKIDYYIGLIKKRKIVDIEDKELNYIIEYMKSISGYSFNKAHAVGYAFNSYYCQYLKMKHPIEFCLANLNAWLGREDKVNLYIRMFKKETKCDLVLGDINSISPIFNKINSNDKSLKIVFGAEAIKGVSRNAINEIRRENRQYKSFFDFLLSNINWGAVNKRAMIPIMEIGYFENFPLINEEILCKMEKEYSDKFSNLKEYECFNYLNGKEKITRGQLCHIFENSKSFRGKEEKYFYNDFLGQNENKKSFDFQIKIFRIVKEYFKTIDFNIKKINKDNFIKFISNYDEKYHAELIKEFISLNKNCQKYFIDSESKGQTELRYIGFNCFNKFKLSEKHEKIFNYIKRACDLKFIKINRRKNISSYTTIGVIHLIRQFYDKNNKKMARIEFNDLCYNDGESRRISAVIFSNVFQVVQKYFKNEDLIIFNANVENNTNNFILNTMKPIELIDEITDEDAKKLSIEEEKIKNKEKKYGKNLSNKSR